MGSFGYLEPHFDEYTMLEELNALAAETRGLRPC